MVVSEGSEFPDLLRQYYGRLFPYKKFHRWLSYGNDTKGYFQHREFSFTLQDDIYIRYQSFTDENEMEQAIQKYCPYKIDIGAVYSGKPKDHKTIKPVAFRPVEKELVFDIDMTDYDEVRTCCDGANICEKCWPFMRIAAKVLDAALREDFGFRNILWVYSGRRGIHCWVCDRRARSLTQDGRTAVADYLSLLSGGDMQTKKVNLIGEKIHPCILRALDIVRPHFGELILKSQDIFSHSQKAEKLVQLFPDEALRNSAREFLKEKKEFSSEEKWKYICDHILGKRNLKCINEIILQYTYPRLDINVSKGLNHLLKSPFCVHPKTGRVCVPIDVMNVDRFDPFSVPTIHDLCLEIDSYDRIHSKGSMEESEKKIKDYKKTSLLGYMETFDAFLKLLEGSNRIETNRKEGSSVTDW